MSRIIPDSVPSAATVPTKVDVVVIGGGIIGVCTALTLAEAGVSVALCEKGLIGGEQSSRNWGWVRQFGRDSRELPLAALSLERWRGMNGRIGDETGFRQTGIAWLCRNTREESDYETWFAQAEARGLGIRLLRDGEIRHMLPGVTDAFSGAFYSPTDGRAEPTKAAPAIARAAIRSGANVLTGCAVRAIELSGGRVSGVVTEKGHVGCSTVVLAGGAWSRLFAGNMGLDLPSLKVLATVARITTVDGVPDLPVGADNFAFRRRLDGGFSIARRNLDVAPIVPDSLRLFADFLPNLVKSWRELKLRVGSRFIEEWRVPRSWSADQISPFEQVRILDPAPFDRFNREGLKNLVAAFPAFAGARLAQSWAGLIDVTPDAIPVIGPVEAIPGFYIASGFSGHGFGIGPGAGQLMAELVMGTSPTVDPKPYRADRFRRTNTSAQQMPSRSPQ